MRWSQSGCWLGLYSGRSSGGQSGPCLAALAAATMRSRTSSGPFICSTETEAFRTTPSSLLNRFWSIQVNNNVSRGISPAVISKNRFAIVDVYIHIYKKKIIYFHNANILRKYFFIFMSICRIKKTLFVSYKILTLNIKYRMCTLLL